MFNLFTKDRVEKIKKFKSLRKIKHRTTIRQISDTNFKIEEVEEDSAIRYVKVATLAMQLLLETLFIVLLFWLQMQKYNMRLERTFDKQSINQLSLFIIPEKYECDLEQIQKTTYFGYDWSIYYGDGGPRASHRTGMGQCNNAGTKATCWTKRNVESTFIHSFLLIISFLTILTNLIELFFNIFSHARKPAIRLQKAVSKNVQVLFKADVKNSERQFQAKTTHDMLQNELRHSNYNLNRAEFYEDEDSRNLLESPRILDKNL